MGLAQQLTALSISYLFKGKAAAASVVESFLAPGYFAASQIAAAGAAATGALGLGLSAATAGASSGSTSGAGGRANYGPVGSASGAGYQPQAGRRVQEQAQKYVVQVYMGNPNDPGAALLMTRQIQTSIARA